MIPVSVTNAMSQVGKIVGYTLLYLWIFWVFFVAVMAIYRQYLAKKLTAVEKFLGLPVVIIGAALDIFCEYTIATVIFLDVPPLKELYVTRRLIRYIKTEPKTEWRYKLAYWICHKMLDNFDPTGQHCTGD
jgi:hypothetical protein